MTTDDLDAALTHAGRWLQVHGLSLLIAVAVAGTVFAGAAWRRHRLALAQRETRVLLPTETFAPSDEEVRRWAAALYATRRRRDWGRRHAEGIRFSLVPEAGLVEYRLQASPRVLALLEPAVPHQVELIRPEPEAEGGGGPEALVGGVPETGTPPTAWASRLWSRRPGRRGSSGAGANAYGDGAYAYGGRVRVSRARAEMRVAPDKTHALAALGLDPDPLTPLVAAMAELGDDEHAVVALDLQPLVGMARRRELRKARGRDKSRPDWIGSLVTSFNQDLTKAPPSAPASASSKGALARVEARAETMTDHDRFASGEPVFRAQLLIWADAPTRRRAKAIVAALAGGLSPMNQRAAWRRVGVLVGPWQIGGPDSSGRRWRFDHRARTGCHHPAKPSIVGAREIAGLIKPPTKNCHAPNVSRGGGLVPPPPAGLPTWTPGAPGLLPIGEVIERGVKRWVGVKLSDTYFTAMFGRSRFGKTWAALVAMIALARQPGVPASRGADLRPGFAFLDPAGTGIDALKAYLVDQADRVRILDLRRRRRAAMAGWNPMDMTGRDPDEIEDIVSMMVAGFSTVLGWTEVNNRAQNLLTQAVSSMCTLGTQLPPELQPTMFQIPTILTNEAWRDEILQFLTPHQREFWTSKLATQTDAKTATSPVTNLIDRFHASRSMVGLFGQSISTFDMRAAMDSGHIVLLCPGGAGDKEAMVHALLLFEIFRAATSRNNIEPEDCRVFHAFLDEMQVADRGAGSVLIARMLQECAKFGLRLHAMAQQPSALSKTTLAAITDNRSHLSSTTVGSSSAAWLCTELGGGLEPGTVTRIRRFHRIVSVSHNGAPSLPFRVRNLALTEAWGQPASPEAVAALEATVDASMGRRPIDDVIADLDTLDQRILLHLTGRPAPRPTGRPVAVANGERRRRAPAAVAPAAIPPADLPAGVASIDRARGPWRAG